MFRFIRYLLLPHHTNNHRSSLIQNSGLFIVLFFILLATIFTYFINRTHPEVLGISYSISDTELLNLVNAERQKMGLTTLKINSELSDAARRKAADMYQKNYWAHFAPDGSTSPWAFIKDAGYSYTYAGENLAKGFTDANSTVVAWMNSQSHRDNILSDKYRDVGFAIVPGTLNGEETVLVVEMFGARSSETLADVPKEDIEPTVTTAPLVAVAGDKNQEIEKTQEATPSKQVASASPIINSQITSKAASTVGLSFLAFALIMDLVIVERKKIPRVVGHNIDHLMLILLFLLFVVLMEGGVVL